MARPKIVNLTDNAKTKIVDFIQSMPTKPMGLRISLKTKGCSGLAWNLDLVKETSKFDEIVDFEEFKVFVDPKAVMYVLGATVDYVKNELEEGFEFSNPNEKGKCGCGESFKV